MRSEDKSRGFTFIVVPHHGGLGKQLEVRGKGLVLFMIALILILALATGAGWVTISGLTRRGRVAQLEDRILQLEDSLQVVVEYQRKLETIEAELADLREARQRIENILCLASGEQPDSASTSAPGHE